jgi:hypothetical protein
MAQHPKLKLQRSEREKYLSVFFWIKLCYRSSMIVREAKLKHGTAEQYSAIDDAIRTAQFIRNKALRYWMDHQGTSKADLYSICKDLACIV